MVPGLGHSDTPEGLLLLYLCIVTIHIFTSSVFSVALVRQSISALNEKSGVSLPSIRKWIQDKHPETKEKQKASFNNLTIKVGGGDCWCHSTFFSCILFLFLLQKTS